MRPTSFSYKPSDLVTALKFVPIPANAYLNLIFDLSVTICDLLFLFWDLEEVLALEIVHQKGWKLTNLITDNKNPLTRPHVLTYAPL